ncbi:hypothetical protein HN51_048333, partial [Arachis hypogaea]
VNTLAAKLYSLGGDWARLGLDTLFFDICRGTGTIGRTLALKLENIQMSQVQVRSGLSKGKW